MTNINHSVRSLAQQYPKSPLASSTSSAPLQIYLTARSPERGNAALTDLQKDPTLANNSSVKITFAELDINNPSSIKSFASQISKNHPDGIDILVNNAGIAQNGFNADVARDTMKTNYYATVEMCETFLPLFRKTPLGKGTSRLVNVASIAGTLGKYPKEIQEKFRNATSKKDVDLLMKDYVDGVVDGTFEQRGWPSLAYSVTKSGVIGYSRVLAKEAGDRVLVNACCPGYVNTDMTKGNGVKTVEQGAKTPVLLSLDDLGSKSGGFWQEEKELAW